MKRQPSSHRKTREAPAHETHSITCFIAGFRYHEGFEITAYLLPGEWLDLIAEQDNPHDPHAVRIEHHKSRVGYVPRAHNERVSAWLRQRMVVRARIITVDWERPAWEAVRILILAEEHTRQSAA